MIPTHPLKAFFLTFVLVIVTLGPVKANELSGLTELSSVKMPVLTHLETISLSGETTGNVGSLSFSPNVQYLAILINNSHNRAVDIIIWDLKNRREQARVENLPIFAFPLMKIRWSPDSNVITLGTGVAWQPTVFWSAMTGKVVHQLDSGALHASGGEFNKNGTEYLVNMTGLLSPTYESGFRIYNTITWNFKDYGSDGLHIQALTWTSDGKVFMVGFWPRPFVGRSIDGVTPRMSDTLARLFDPTGVTQVRTVVLAHGTPDKKLPNVIHQGPFKPYLMTKAAMANVVALGSGQVMAVDIQKLEVLSVYDSADAASKSRNLPDGFFGDNVAVSPDGQLVYLVGSVGQESLIITAHGGEQVGRFPGADRGVAISADGKYLAEGIGNRVELQNIN